MKFSSIANRRIPEHVRPDENKIALRTVLGHV